MSFHALKALNAIATIMSSNNRKKNFFLIFHEFCHFIDEQIFSAAKFVLRNLQFAFDNHAVVDGSFCEHFGEFSIDPEPPH